MYNKILIPLDGSKLSESILPYGRALAGGLRLPVELLQVINPETISLFADPQHGRYIDTVEADMRRNSLAYLKGLAKSFANSSAVNCHVEIGRPAEIIVDRAAAQRGAMIAMATHGRAGMERWFLGSVADKVLRTAANPLLLVRGAADGKADEKAALKTILVPLDGSGLAERVLPHVAELAKKMSLEVILIRVFSLFSEAYIVEGYTPNMDRILEQVREESRTYLEQKVEQLHSEGLDKVSSVLLEGDDAGEIIDMAKKTPDSLVTMCTHGRSGLGRLVLGSVTDRVVRHAGNPVLVIRASTPS